MARGQPAADLKDPPSYTVLFYYDLEHDLLYGSLINSLPLSPPPFLPHFLPCSFFLFFCSPSLPPYPCISSFLYSVSFFCLFLSIFRLSFRSHLPHSLAHTASFSFLSLLFSLSSCLPSSFLSFCQHSFLSFPILFFIFPFTFLLPLPCPCLSAVLPFSPSVFLSS